MISGMSNDRSSTPNEVEATIRSRRVRATCEPGQVATTPEPGRPTNPYWVIEVNGTRYAGFPAAVDDTEASVRAQLVRWADDHPAAFRGPAGGE